jgi:hypothetical protein
VLAAPAEPVSPEIHLLSSNAKKIYEKVNLTLYNP